MSIERWLLERRTSLNDSEILVIDNAEVYLSLKEEYRKLITTSKKLAFFDKYPDLFEFPFCTQIIHRGDRVCFTFEFLPNLKEPQEVASYNEWFIKRSRAELKKHEAVLRGLPIIDGKELIELFNLKKDRIHLLDDFVKYESERVKALCDQAFPNRFDLLYSLTVREANIDFSIDIIGPNIWQDLFIWPYAKYIYELKKYNLTKSNEQQQQLLQALREIKALTGKATTNEQRPKRQDYTIKELFKNNTSKLNLFLTILISRGYLTENGRWSNIRQAGDFLPIVDYLKKNKIIKNVSSAMLWRIFEKEIGPIMSERNFRVTNHQFCLDELLETALSSLVKQ